MLPIFNHRQIVGHAKTATQAKRIIADALQTIPKGWKITVRMRDTSIIKLPAGWVYSVHP